MKKYLLIVLIFVIALNIYGANTYQAELRWEGAYDGGIPDGYKIYRSNESGVYGDAIADIPEVNQKIFVDTGLVYSESYYYVVTAYNDIGESGYSNEVFFTVLEPNPPTNVTVTVKVVIGN